MDNSSLIISRATNTLSSLCSALLRRADSAPAVRVFTAEEIASAPKGALLNRGFGEDDLEFARR